MHACHVDDAWHDACMSSGYAQPIKRGSVEEKRGRKKRKGERKREMEPIKRGSVEEKRGRKRRKGERKRERKENLTAFSFDF